jgi:hypothetical protein
MLFNSRIITLISALGIGLRFTVQYFMNRNINLISHLNLHVGHGIIDREISRKSIPRVKLLSYLTASPMMLILLLLAVLRAGNGLGHCSCFYLPN